ncbi:DeoR/GlpR family DNA-binding transcription regulator [Vagococcus lutrae]|uniref:DeoR/GlpR family DNA-binding transcription regulator n=1 Tax=Vagococcus lutrae TaxID=81947 RepID=UPI000F86C380|nr:DeoR/GlpR family DNA-binding transcription regulator [Vagococcus lutrae]MDT2808333.1 DeoR/GlpR family DNA-binding transcription regulator [Vagococcus lutrae]RST91667.1 DeoR family transcriptional regulator [Vagococcus lutrae]UQF38241.1 DeoR/GlpR family DNA-binding transcription regulator [Vagococcus lutrae]GEQ61084.1 DeoR family transcriptional regulator [Vagococcus lutrae]GEQ62989.1 DeoR family transcriptional regulator [Vagococcus lutrae]
MKAKRNDLIKEYILEKEHVTLKELEETFNVSMNTIRRDVAKIITDPRFEKVYGGVSVKKNKLISFENRSIKNKEVKQKIAEEAAKLIQPHDLIYIDSGTTTKYILDYLPKDIEMTIITNSLDIVLKAEVFEKIQVFLLGNMFKRSTRSFVGITPDQITNKYNISKAFMAATAVSIDNGMMNSDLMEYEIKKHIVDKAANIYLLADKSKFEKSTLLTYASLDQVDKIITDKDFDAPYLDFFNDKQIEPITVDI